MLKVIVMLDCNLCGRLFDHVSATEDRDPANWKSLCLDLEYTAEKNGWICHRSAHHCDYCITDAMVADGKLSTIYDDSDQKLPF